MEVGVAIVAVILLGVVGFALAARRRMRETPEVGDPYETLYPGRHERRAPLRREGRGSRPGEGAEKLHEDR